ncbi:flavin-containing monooxygenase [Streptomyces antnestii]|nr:alpha/beta hydrolase fold domain-containing protein [Streptomyces sp. San01]
MIRVDAVVIGAGFAGVYAVHKLRDEVGLQVRGIEAAETVGGVWHWNRYPGARCDVHSTSYSYSFSDELTQSWEWTEAYAPQPEIKAYLNHAADCLDVRKEFAFNTRVTSVVWEDDEQRWTVSTDRGDTYSAQFVVGAQGNLSVAKDPTEFVGLDNFQGEKYFTSSWPAEEVDFSGKRVCLVGTGSTGTQIAEVIAKTAGHLTIMQRTANFAVPGLNHTVEPEQRTWNAQNAAALRARDRLNFYGVTIGEDLAPLPSAAGMPDDERQALFDTNWPAGGDAFLQIIADLVVNEESNKHVSDYVRDRIRDRVNDPEVAELLCPTDHPILSKRIVLENGYYDIFNQDNVSLVSVKNNPIERYTERGLRLADGTAHEFDMIVMATGFDSITGPVKALGLRGRNGVALDDVWADGPVTYVGSAIPGFPNFFLIVGPTGPAAFYNNPVSIEDFVDHTASAIKSTLDSGCGVIEATEDAARRWYAIASGLFDNSLLPYANSWYRGVNVPGKKPATYILLASGVLWRAYAAAIKASGMGGFALDGVERSVPPVLKLGWAATRLFDEMLLQLAGETPPPLRELDIATYREMADGFTAAGGIAPRDLAVADTTYSGPGGDLPMRVFTPRGEAPKPVVMYLFGGGFVSGSVEAHDNLLRLMADELDVVVAAPQYRLAPENPFPAAPDDAYAALQWVAANIDSYGGDPERIVIAGESSGGNLAAVTALRARDEHGPALIGQALFEPAIDAEADTASRREYAEDWLMSAADAATCWSYYLGEDLKHAASPLASPLRASSLVGLPPAAVVTAECDILRDEGEQYAAALQQAGVPTTLVRMPGTVHGGLPFIEWLPEYRAAFTAISDLVARTGAPATEVLTEA